MLISSKGILLKSIKDDTEAGIAKRIKSLRMQREMSQEEFANSLGINASVIKNSDCGRVKPSCELVAIVSRQFNVDIGWLFNGVQQAEGSVPFFSAFAQLSDDQQNYFYHLIMAEVLSKKIRLACAP